jgi:hypothetical protein
VAAVIAQAWGAARASLNLSKAIRARMRGQSGAG